MPAIIYLGGDSYPAELDIEKRFAQGLGDALALPVIGQMSMLHEGESIHTCSVAKRIDQLDAVAGLFCGPIILVGRSSGARVASYFAHHYRTRHHILGVICLAYPFCPQGGVRDPHRFAHLADIATPTLIFQGYRDRYGGQEVQSEYLFSPVVKLRMIDADHEFGMKPAEFDVLLDEAKNFIRQHL